MIRTEPRVSAIFVAISSWLLIMLVAIAAHAQISEYSFKSLTVDQGLSQNSVYAILQDRRGFMWFGTKDGLNRYDGYNFVIYKHDPNDSTSLADNNVNVVYEDRVGRMWVSTLTALHLYLPKSDKFQRIVLVDPVTKDKSPVIVNAIAEDSIGNLWLTTQASGIIRLTISGDYPPNLAIAARFFLYNPDDSKILQRNGVTVVYVDQQEMLWIGSSGVLQSINPLTLKQGFDSNRINIPGFYSDTGIFCFYEDAEGTLWLGTTAGLGKYDRTNNSIRIYRYFSVRTICEDERGTLWLGTFGRLVLFDPRIEQYQTVPRHVEEANDLFRTGTVRITRDRSGALWLGSNGYGVFRYDAVLSRFQSFTKATAENIGWTGHSVRSLYEDSRDRLWVGSYGGLYVTNPARTNFSPVSELGNVLIRGIVQDSRGMFWFASYGLAQFDSRTKRVQWHRHNPRDAASIRSNEVSGVSEDCTGTIWAVTNGVLSKYDHDTGRFTHFQFAAESDFSINDPTPVGMYEDYRHRIWLATERGIFVFDPVTQQFIRYTSKASDEHALRYPAARCITPDPHEPERVLWVGTAGGGLYRLDLQTERFTSFTEADGLSNNVVYGILSDADGNLWLSTNRGIVRFHPASQTFRTYLSQDGLQSNEYNSGAYFKSRSGEMFFGGIQGFDAFFPEKLQERSYIPEVVITEFQLFNKPVTLGDPRVNLTAPITEAEGITLSYSQNVFSLTFASLDYTAPQKNLYQYKLEGFDEGFGPPTSNRRATYTNLDPGEYVFRVRGSNSDGVWNEQGASLGITVLPPFWMSWWFRALIGILVLSVGPIVYYRRVSVLKQEHSRQQEFSRRLIDSQESERKRIAAELHDSLGQNLLVMKNRAVLGLQNTKLPKAIRNDLTEISSTASATLKEVREISHNLRPYELDRFGLTEAIRSVVEKVQASSSVAFTIDIDDFDGAFDKESEINVYRSVQECLNNILKHAEATRALVRVKKNSGTLQIIVQDNGKGFNKAFYPRHSKRTSGLGLTSLEERTRILNGSFTITSVPGSGTTISMTIPVERKNDGS